MSRRHRRDTALPKLSGAVRTGHGSKYRELNSMNREVRQHFDVLVIGGGPAGMAAAARAAECGVRVGIVDDNANLGGQIWRGASRDDRGKDAARWSERVQA